MKYEAVCIAVGGMTGLLFCFYGGVKFGLLFAVICVLLIVLCLFMTTGIKRKTAALILLSASAACAYSAVYTHFTADRLVSLSGETAFIEGFVTEAGESDSTYAVVSGRINGIKGKARIYLRNANVSAGDKISLEARIEKIDNNSMFDSESYNRAKGIFINAYSPENISVQKASGLGAAYSGMLSYRERLTSKLITIAGLDEGRLLSCMLCGSGFSDEIRALLSSCGIGHILSVSGIHVSIAAMFISFLMSRLKAGRYLTFFISESAVLLFVVFSGLRVSAIRASVMISVFLFAETAKRRYDSMTALAVAVIIMTAVNPYCVGDVSFLLSVSGAFGAGAAAPAVSDAFCITGKLKRSAVSAACAFICTLPAAAFCFDEISLVSVVMNVMLIPLCTAALCLCMIFAAAGGPVFLNFLIKAAGFMMTAVIKICKIVSDTGVSSIPIRFKALPVIILFALIITALCYVLTSDVKRTSFAALILLAAVLSVMSVLTVIDKNKVHVNAVSDGGGYILVISKNNEAFAVDSNGGFAYEYSRLAGKNGITRLDGAVILDKGIPSYPKYLKFSPGMIIMPDAENAVGTEAKIINLVGGTVIDVYGITLTVESGACVRLDFGGEEFYVSAGSLPDCDSFLYAVDGVTVMKNNGKVTAVKGVYEIEVR